MHEEHGTSEEGRPASQGEEFLELPLLLSSRHLAALKTAAFRQGVTVGPLLRRLIEDYLAVLRESELAGEKLFFGKAQCAVCHPAPFYHDNQMPDLHVERFLKHEGGDGPIETFTLRGIKDSPPYLHDGGFPCRSPSHSTSPGRT